MSILSSNNLDLSSISIKGLHNRSISILKEMISSPVKNELFLIYFLKGKENHSVLQSMAIHLPDQIQKNPELTNENIQIMKEYLYHRFKDTGMPLKDLDTMSDPIKEKDYIL